MAMEESSAYFGVTDYGDYVDLLPSTSAASLYDEDSSLGSLSSNNCTQAIKQVSLEMQPLRKNPIYIKVTVFYKVSHPLAFYFSSSIVCRSGPGLCTWKLKMAVI